MQCAVTSHFFLSLVLMACLCGSPVQAGTPELAAVPTTAIITVDGVLSEAAWQSAQTVDTLRQREPDEGAPASERTEVRVLYSPRRLYIGITCFDTNPEAIVASRFDRDAKLDADDRVSLLLDTFHDRRNAFVFQVNAVGARFDQIISDEGQDLNPDWNGIWYARTRLTAQGWNAEVLIPFQTLSFASGQSVWGFNVQRVIKRNNEEAVWAGYRQNLTFFRVSEAGLLTGLIGINQGLGLDVSPFVSAVPRRRATNFQPGLNAFYKLTPGLTLSVTLNTDFGETVVDDSQINLTRFSLFFPEKRQFFLEDAGNFAVDDLTGMSRPLALVPFFSRRIGLDADDKPVDLLGGVKLSGRTGPYRLGLMSVQAQQREPVPGENFSVIRVKRDLFTKSSVGFIATRRTPERGPASGLAGGDFRYSTSELRGKKNLSWSAFFLKSFIPGATRDMAWGTALNMPNDTWEVATSYHEVQEDFDATLGFVPRNGIRRFRWFVRGAPRPGRWATRQVSCASGGSYYADPPTNRLLTRFIGFPCWWRFNSGDELRAFTFEAFQRLTEGFEISDGVTIAPGSYRYRRYRTELQSADKRPVGLYLRYEWGKFYSGKRDDWTGRLELRPGPAVFFSAEYQQNDVRLAEGNFVVRLVRGRLSLAAGPELSWFGLVQYDTVSDMLNLNSQLRWIIEPGNDFFIVYNHHWHTPPGRFRAAQREGRIKVRYTCRF